MGKLTKRSQAKGGTTCCIPGCGNKYTTSKEIVMYTFPNELRFPGRRAIWQDAIRRSGIVSKDWEPSHHGRVCNMHFQGHKKSDDADDVDYIPSLFPLQSATQGLNKKQLERSERSQELLARKTMLLQEYPDVVANGAEASVTKRETSSVGVGCWLRPDTQRADVGFLIFSCFSDGFNLATQVCTPGRRKVADRGTQVNVGALP